MFYVCLDLLQNKDEDNSKSSLLPSAGIKNVLAGGGGSAGADDDEKVPVSFSSFPEFGQKKTNEEEQDSQGGKRPGIGKEEVKDGVVIIEAVPMSHDSSRPSVETYCKSL
jgi:hypothetical protein